MRALRVSVAVVAGFLFAAAAGTLIALAASSLRAPDTRARMSMCQGARIRIDRAAPALGIKPLLVKIVDRDNHLVWIRRRLLGAPQRKWMFRARRAQTYRVVFHHNFQTRILDLLVVPCAKRVAIRENDRGRAMFRLNDMKPGVTKKRCIRVIYAGKVPARVRLYGTTSGRGLDRYLDVVITRGWARRDEFPSCRTFVPDRTNYARLGKGVVFVGTLEGLPDSWASAMDDATSRALRPWLGGQSHVYRIAVTLPKRVGNEAQSPESVPELGRYDVVVAAEVLEHLYTAPTLVLRYLATALEPDGALIVQTPNAVALKKRLQMLRGRNPAEPIREERMYAGHFHEYTPAELADAAHHAGLEVASCVTANYFRTGSRKNALFARAERWLPPGLRDGITAVLVPANRSGAQDV